MRVTVSHNKPVEEVKRSVDRGFDEIFKGLPIAPLEILDEKREWNGQTMNFAFTAKLGFVSIPMKGLVEVEQKLVTIDIDLPAFLNNLIPEQKLQTAIEGKVKGLLT